MNLPNLLTILRILLIPFFINLLIYGYYRSALGVFLLAGITDGLDGLIARTANQRTELGTYLDPLADKLLLTSGFASLSILGFIPTWSAVVVVSRDAILILGVLILHLTQPEVKIQPSFLGKITTVAQLAYILLVLVLMVLGQNPERLFFLLILTVLFTVLSGLHYIYRNLKL
jgi:cardiolipin synthase